ncbi:hypothetical protein Taro_036228 [Colocasia esculenta]|uniref:Glutamine amidotransferase type-2 domain-containing protein n=1 Tax=Colocasia esculenta TaxID=4460 RepID=A0A843W7V7_COLES|nr:hypothetical protein [Colocasia esculenta]
MAAAAAASSSSQHLSPISHGLRQCSHGVTHLHLPSTSRCLLPIFYSSSFPQDPWKRAEEGANGGCAFDGRDDKPREECGVVGSLGDPQASCLCSLTLHALQHRGQEGVDIFSYDGGTLMSVTGLGLVFEVFGKDPSRMDTLPRDATVKHVRYSTAGVTSSPLNVQPFLTGYHFGQVVVAHNGNLVNYAALRWGRWRGRVGKWGRRRGRVGKCTGLEAHMCCTGKRKMGWF